MSALPVALGLPEEPVWENCLVATVGIRDRDMDDFVSGKKREKPGFGEAADEDLPEPLRPLETSENPDRRARFAAFS